MPKQQILISAVLSRCNFRREFTHFFGVPFTGLKNMVAYQKWQIWGMCISFQNMIDSIYGFPPCNSWWECHNPTTSVGLCQKPIKAHITTEKWTLHIFWSLWHTCWMEGLRVMESLMEALNSGEHFSTAVAWWRAVDYDVQLTTTWRLRRAPSANGGSRSLLLSSRVLPGSL